MPQNETTAPLQGDIKFLHGIFSTIIRQREGEIFFGKLTEILAASEKYRTDRNQSHFDLLTTRVSRLNAAEAETVTRALTCYLTLVNIAEEHNKVRLERRHRTEQVRTSDGSPQSARPEPREPRTSMSDGSRPAKRREGGIEALRAIPWIFAWTQTRAMLPSWLGVGAALAAIEDSAHEKILQQMRRDWYFFRSFMDLVEMVLLKSDARISAYYDSELAPEALWHIGILAMKFNQNSRRQRNRC